MCTCSIWIQGCGTLFCHKSDATNLKIQEGLEFTDLTPCVAEGH